MRTQVTIVPTFWTRGSGKKLRGNPVAQVLALYLMTSPHSTMVGVYYESLTSILHETGLTEEQFRSALPEVAEIALYDEEAGLVFLPEGAAHQIGETMSAGDKKRKSIMSQLEVYGDHEFVRRWIERYYFPYNLSKEGISPPSASPFDAPSMGHARPVHAPDPRSDPYPRSDPRSRPAPGAKAPMVASLQVRAQAWVRDPVAASLSYTSPHQWTETLELAALVAQTFGIEPEVLRPPAANGSLDPRVRVVLERWAEGNDQARLRLAIRGAKQSSFIAGKPELQTLVTILKDASAVDKYARLAKGRPDPPSTSPENVARAREFFGDDE